MKKWPLEVGRVALSRAGRDEGRKFLVIEEIDADFVFVADGKNRGMERPKKKRRSHGYHQHHYWCCARLRPD